jgi:hypothetical protein
MVVLGGIVTQKPIGVVSNNPNFGKHPNAEAAAQKKQQAVDALVDKLAAQNTVPKAPEPEKRWSVKF